MDPANTQTQSKVGETHFHLFQCFSSGQPHPFDGAQSCLAGLNFL